MSRGKRENKRDGVFMKACIALIILQVIAYTWVHLWFSADKGIEIAPVTSAAFYGFCGFEAGVCGYIKKNKNQ